MNVSKMALSLVFGLLACMTLQAQDLAGHWKGTLTVQGIEIEMTYNLEEKEGVYAATLDVPIQGVSGYELDKVVVDGDKVTITSSQLQMKFEGQRSKDKIEGTYNQMGENYPLVLEKTDKTIPGDFSLPSSEEELMAIAALEKGEYKYSVEDYFEKPNTSSFQFSPNGKYFSYREKDDKAKNHIYVKNTSTNKVTKVIEEGEELVRGYGWVNDNRLVYIKDSGGDENYQLFAANIDGSNQKALTPFDGVTVQFSNLLKEQPDYIIIMMNKDNKQIHEPYKLNVVTGEMKKLYENTDMTNPVVGYEFDKDGDLRCIIKQQNGTEYVLYYKTAEDKPFEEVVQTDWKDNFSIVGFDYNSPNKNDAYVLTNLESNTNELVLYDLAEKKILKKVYSNPTFDVGGLNRSRKRNYEVDYYQYTGEKRHIVPVSETYKKLHKKFEKEFGDKQFYISSVTDEEDKYLLYVTSDKLYGSYFVFDTKTQKFSKLLDLMPQLKEEDMAEMRSIQYTSRDGKKIYAYLTIPKGAEASGKKVPMIVNPHGGPYGVRDNWGFNPETQLFASRGYATLQINYRGSGGYGKEFFLAGSKQIGRKMLDDLEDGVKHAKTLSFIDKDKIAIYGASYGGLATLGSLVKTPELYTCGIDYVGVSNLFTFFKSFPEYWKPFLAQFFEQWYNPEDEQEKAWMTAASPALNVDKINKPLLVVQGANDPRVNIDESDQVVKNMRNRGIDVPYMVKYNEGHGFGHEENRVALYKVMMGFFAQHLK